MRLWQEHEADELREEAGVPVDEDPSGWNEVKLGDRDRELGRKERGSFGPQLIVRFGFDGMTHERVDLGFVSML